MLSTDLAALAADAYIYGLPLVRNLSMVSRATTFGLGTLPPAPFNHFAHATQLAGPGTEFGSVSDDTVYSVAQLDLSAGPLLLHTPDTGGAYHVLQFVDAWSNNFAYLGHRTTGTAESEWLIVPPGWSGTAPDGVPVITSPTTVASIVGRHACGGPDDLPRITGLQKELTLRPPDGRTAGQGLPEADPDVPDALRFFEELRIRMAAFPPSAADRTYQEAFAPLGLLRTTARSPYANGSTELSDALRQGMANGSDRVSSAHDYEHGAPVEGWETHLHLFDYNLDYFGPGTVDSPRWKIPDRRAAYLTRAVAARIGLWGSHAYETFAARGITDADGEPLNGAHSYTLRFDSPPPVHAFWSITMYGTPGPLLVRHPTGRYSIGDRTPGLRHGDDGSLTLALQYGEPSDPAQRANWLPTPEGDFRPTVRLYEPDEEVLDERYHLPLITRR